MFHDPEINIKMGVYYIRQMLDNFNQNKYYALGAYNSGLRCYAKMDCKVWKS